MTNIKLLSLYNDFLTANKNVATSMIWAIEDFERGREAYSWSWLFDWCECKDERSEIWKRLQDHYPEALTLKEGVSS